MKAVGNLYLVGPMGAGKSTVGRKLAQSLHLTFYDSDREIERRTGAAIPLIFELEGEAGFRAREGRMIERLVQLDGVVLATGGGAVLDADNRSRLAAGGTVIYLHASVNQQLARTSRDQNRPLLQTENPRARLEQLLAARDPLYREIADLVVETDGRSVHSVVQEILRRLGLRAKVRDRKPGSRRGKTPRSSGPGDPTTGRR
jgi:shikimate kinase